MSWSTEMNLIGPFSGSKKFQVSLTYKRLIFRCATEGNLSEVSNLNMKREQTEALEQRLCKAYGFCCHGTLFLHVGISESEPIRACGHSKDFSNLDRMMDIFPLNGRNTTRRKNFLEPL